MLKINHDHFQYNVIFYVISLYAFTVNSSAWMFGANKTQYKQCPHHNLIPLHRRSKILISMFVLAQHILVTMRDILVFF